MCKANHTTIDEDPNSPILPLQQEQEQSASADFIGGLAFADGQRHHEKKRQEVERTGHEPSAPFPSKPEGDDERQEDKEEKAVEMRQPQAPLLCRADLDMEEQRISAARERSELHFHWVAHNAPPDFSPSEHRHSLRGLILSSVLHHRQRQSLDLDRHVRSIVRAVRPALLENIPAANTQVGLPEGLLNVLYTDIDVVLATRGVNAARTSVSKLPLWQPVPLPGN